MIEQVQNMIRTHFWLTITGVFIFLFFFIVIEQLFPLLRSIQSVKQEIYANQLKIANARDWNEASVEMLQHQGSINKTMDILLNKEDQKEHVSQVMSFLASLAKKNHIEIEEIVPSDRYRQKTVDELPLQLTINGRYHAAGRFIDAVETNGSMIKINQLNIEARNMTQTDLRIMLYLNVYFMGNANERE